MVDVLGRRRLLAPLIGCIAGHARRGRVSCGSRSLATGRPERNCCAGDASAIPRSDRDLAGERSRMRGRRRLIAPLTGCIAGNASAFTRLPVRARETHQRLPVRSTAATRDANLIRSGPLGLWAFGPLGQTNLWSPNRSAAIHRRSRVPIETTASERIRTWWTSWTSPTTYRLHRGSRSSGARFLRVS